MPAYDHEWEQKQIESCNQMDNFDLTVEYGSKKVGSFVLKSLAVLGVYKITEDIMSQEYVEAAAIGALFIGGAKIQSWIAHTQRITRQVLDRRQNLSTDWPLMFIILS